MKFVPLILAVVVIGAVAWFAQPSPEGDSVAESPSGKVVEPESILAALPPPRMDLLSGRERAAAQKKAAKALNEGAAWVALGDALAKEFRDSANDALIEHAESVFRHAPSAGALAGLAWAAVERGDLAASLDLAKRAVALDENSPAAWAALGDAHLAAGAYRDAAEAYDKVMKLQPDASSWARGAELLWLTGAKTKALWLLQKAVRPGAAYEEETAWCRARLAMMYFQDGAYEPARQMLEPALTAGAKHAPILLAAGRVAAALGDLDRAAEHCRALLEHGPNHEALALLGDVHSARGETAKAEECYRAVEKLGASRGRAAKRDLSMAKFLADHDRDLGRALDLVEAAKDSANVLKADLVAWARFKNGDLTGAVEAMKRALKYNTPDAAMRFHAGMIAAAAGDRPAARRRLNEALSMSPKFDLLLAPLAVKALEESTAVAERSNG